MDEAGHGTSFSRSVSKHRADAVVEETGPTLSPGAVDVEVTGLARLVVVVDNATAEEEFVINVEDAMDGRPKGSTMTAQLVAAIMPGADVLFMVRLGIAYTYPPDLSGISVNVSYCTEVVGVAA